MSLTSPSPVSTSYASDVRGRVEPRLWTPPLRDLSDPANTFGYELIDFAEDIGWPLDPWQKWLAIHLGELMPDALGRMVPRFRIVLVLVARQNGKSVFCRILTLYWMFVETVPYIFGINSTRDTAKKSWKEVIKMAESIEMLAEELPPVHIIKQQSEEAFWNALGSTYLFGAPNSRAGRSLTINRAIIDELRQHKNRDAWDALIPTMNAVYDAQAVIITNEGDESAVVLHELTESAEEFISTGVGDPRLGMFSWSAPEGSDPTDTEALAYANPDLGNRTAMDAIIGQAIQAKRAGGETLARFRIEIMCQRVPQLNPAIEPGAWTSAGTTHPLDLANHRDRVALCLDVALDGSHATLVAAATIDGTTHIEVVRKWSGYGCTKAVRHDLPGLVARIKPRRFGFFRSGPAASIYAALSEKNGDRQWPPRRVELMELDALRPAVCMGLAEAVLSGEVQHPEDEMLNAHVKATQRSKPSVDGTWVFMRRNSSPIDGSYALAGAVHMARTMPTRAPLVAL